MPSSLLVDSPHSSRFSASAPHTLAAYSQGFSPQFNYRSELQ
jgi:hypothetical protein